ncbi:hypothetical protein ACJX0J_027414, partial [Zea mays]
MAAISCMTFNLLAFLLGFRSRGPEDTWFWCFLVIILNGCFPIRCTNEKLNTDQLQAIIHRIADMAGHATYLRKGLLSPDQRSQMNVIIVFIELNTRDEWN